MLQHVEDDAARCVHCGRLAVGPCARCRSPVCGDCCDLVQGASQAYAVCVSCLSHAQKLRSAWWQGVWPVLLVPIAVLALAVALLAWLSGL